MANSTRKRQRAYEAAREGEGFFHALIDSARDGVAVLDRDGVFRYASWSLERLLGYAPAELTERKVFDFVHPDDLRTAIDTLAEVGRTEAAAGVAALRFRCRDGSWRTVELDGENRMDDPAVGGVVLTFRDISGRRHTEDRLRRTNRILRTMGACNHALVHAKEETQLLHKICQAVVKLGGYRFVWVGYAEHDAASTVRPVAHAGHEEGYLQTLNLTWADDPALGQSPMGRAIRLGRRAVSQDIRNDPRFAPWRDEALKRGYGSVLSVPLMEGDAAFGAVSILAAEPHAFDKEEYKLLGELANDMAYGIVALRTRAARRKAERALREHQARLLEAEHIAHLGSWEWDVAGGEMRGSDEMHRLLGLGREVRVSCRSVLELIPAYDRARVEAAAREALAGRAEYRVEHDILRPEGSVSTLQAAGKVIRDTAGRPCRMVGTALDITERKRMERERVETLERLQRAMFQTIQAVAQTIEKRDPYTAGHQLRVARLAMAIGEEMGLPRDELAGLRLGASVHDIGKIYLPAEILGRPGALSRAEVELIKTHTLVGHDIMKGAEFPWPIAEMILQHHERLDGSGYPEGRTAAGISRDARILAVADVVEAMATNRPYRPALGIGRALEEIVRNRGTLYDPQVVAACVRLFRKKGYTLEPAGSDPDGGNWLVGGS